MTAPVESAAWDVEVRPRRMIFAAWGAAVVIAAVHVAVALLLNIRSSGVVFQTADQVAFAALGLIVAGVLLLFTRPRLRAGAVGVSVRNLLGDRLIPWSEVVGVSFPAAKRWAQVDLPDDEYLAVMAIQAVDKERAVAAMQQVRAVVARYRPAD